MLTYYRTARHRQEGLSLLLAPTHLLQHPPEARPWTRSEPHLTRIPISVPHIHHHRFIDSISLPPFKASRHCRFETRALHLRRSCGLTMPHRHQNPGRSSTSVQRPLLTRQHRATMTHRAKLHPGPLRHRLSLSRECPKYHPWTTTSPFANSPPQHGLVGSGNATVESSTRRRSSSLKSTTANLALRSKI